MSNHRKVANTEDRVKPRDSVCQYHACGARLRPSQVADGWDYCDEECWQAARMEDQIDITDDDDD
jgi:hypothetical protein